MKINPEQNIDPRLSEEFRLMQAVPMRDAQRAASGRAAFLAQAEEFSKQAVSPAAQSRHSGWISNLFLFLKPQKERTPMNIIASMIMVVSMLLGTGGLTVAAAQASLPNDLLYPVKVWSEDVRLDLAPDAQTRMQLELEFSERRVAEVQAMVQSGQVPPEAVQLRLQTHLQTAMQAALGQANEEALQALAQIQARMQIQLQTMEQLHSNQPDNAVMEQMRQTLREQLRLAELGLEDPEQLRLMQQQQTQTQQQPDEPPMQGTGDGPGPMGTPGSGDGPGPMETPGSGDGSGPQTTPGQGNGQGGNGKP